MARLRSILAALVAASLLPACPSVTALRTRYSPLHPANGVAPTVRIQATNKKGVSRVELYAYEYELATGTTILTAQRRPGGMWGIVRTWTYPALPHQIEESQALNGFPARSFITYIVRASGGDTTTTEDWSFAAGDWPAGVPIPLLGNGAPASRIDIAFVADRDDYTNARDMLSDIEPLIFDGYHKNNVIEYTRGAWQFYYSQDRGSISDYDTACCTMDVPSSVADSGIIDSAAIIHTTVKRDWASSGNFGTEPTNKGTAVHESAHAVFNLADEYNGGGHFTSTARHHNNFDSEDACKQYNRTNSWPETDCQLIQAGWWRPETSALKCIMWDDGDATMPDFARTCEARAWQYTLELTAGQ